MSSEAASAAEDAAEAVRRLARATLPAAGALEHPADVYGALSGLQAAAAALPQALTQMARWLEAGHRAGRVGHDQGRDPASAVASTLDRLRAAQTSATRLGDVLSDAQNACANLTGK